MYYKRVVIIDEDILSNILNSKIINNNLKGVITYDFINADFALNFLSKNTVDLILIEESLVKSYLNRVKWCQQDTPIYVLTDKFESEFFKKYPDINSYISNPILKSNTHIIEKAIFQN